MRINNLGESIFDSNDIIDIIYQGHANKVSNLIVEQDPEILQFQTALNTVFQKETTGVDQSSFDQNNQHNWAMPQEYKDLDIEQWIYDQGPPWDPDHARIQLELAEFQNLKTTTKSKFVKCFSSYFKAHRFFNASSVTRCLDYMFNI